MEAVAPSADSAILIAVEGHIRAQQLVAANAYYPFDEYGFQDAIS
jgi:hypothetical protein